MRSPCILIVDDDAALLAALSEALELRIPQIRVETASSRNSALTKIAATDYDAIFLDSLLPGAEAGGLLRYIKAARSTTPTLVFCDEWKPSTLTAFQRIGADGLMEKPLDRTAVAAWVLLAVRHKRLLRRIAAEKHVVAVARSP